MRAPGLMSFRRALRIASGLACAVIEPLTAMPALDEHGMEMLIHLRDGPAPADLLRAAVASGAEERDDGRLRARDGV